MRAVTLESVGPDATPQVTEVGDPLQLMSDVLVQVHAAGINPIDWKTISGKGAAAGIQRFPWIPGNDFAGTVLKSPYELAEFQPGDEVFGFASPALTWGSYAEKVAVSTLQIAKKPESLSFIEAAAVPCAGLTAWDAVVRVAKARSGQRILVHAGAGGVGHFAVQLAHYFGAHVIATGSERSLDYLREIGADEVVDYRNQRFEEVLQKVDVVVDLIGNVKDDTGSRSLNVLKSDGLYLNIPTNSWPEYAEASKAAGVRYSHIKVEPDGQNLAILARLLEAGDVKVNVDSVFPLEQVRDALQQQAEGHTRGKVVLSVR